MSARPTRLPWLAFAATLFGVLASSGVLGPVSELALARGRVLDEPFRLWTGHFVHFNATHVVADLVPFAIWAALVERDSRGLLAVTLAVGTAALSVALLLACPELSTYRGLSGLDCALAVELIALRLGPRFAETPPGVRRVALAAAALFALKCGFELVTGHAVAARDLGQGVSLLPEAHYFGAAIGCAFALSLGAHGRPKPAVSTAEARP